MFAKKWYFVACLTGVISVAGGLTGAPPGEREAKVRGDKARFEDDESWVYNDWSKAVAEGRRSGKPLLVIVRCVPCEACSKFDDELVRRVDEVRDLMDRFICVRIVTTNGLDLDQFQFDYDQSFHAFLMHADGTIYGRFGTRSESRDESQDMTMPGFRRALELALAWHAAYPANKDQFAGKHGPPPLVRHPEEFPNLRERYTSELNYEGNVVQSCIHCHQIREAERMIYRQRATAGAPIPQRVIYPHPLPKVIGLTMNAQQAAEIKDVAADSPAARAGLRAGDRIVALGGQPLLSIADLQWVLHQAADAAQLPATLEREGEKVSLVLDLPSGWRTRSDLSWRPTSWDLRRIAFGGMVLDELPAERRTELGLAADTLGLHVRHVGEFGEHAKAKQAGFRKGDVLVEFNGSRQRRSETDLLVENFSQRRPGDKVPVVVRRDGRDIPLTMPVQ